MGLESSCEPLETPDVSGNDSATDPAEITPTPPGLETRSDIVQLAAIGIHVHQGDFGPSNLRLHTLVAVSLIWLSATGIVLGGSGARRGRSVSARAPRSVGTIIAVVAMAVLLRIFGLSVAVIAAGSRLARVRA
jgi:uncharacterized iron-regulated membrane protein